MHNNVIQTKCKRCGKCCQKGGPALHLEDRELLVRGMLVPADLVTFRKGEPAWHPITREVIFLEDELIKIRGHGKIGTCCFFDKKAKHCRIYRWRPLECRLLKCWDTRDLEAVFMKDLLQRLDVIPKDSSLTKLLERYDEVFDLERIGRTMLNESKISEDLVCQLQDLSSADADFRDTVRVHFGLSEKELDFFLGRSVGEVMLPVTRHLVMNIDQEIK